MSEMVVIHDISKITSLKLGMWLLFQKDMMVDSQFVYVNALSNGYATLSNGLTVNGAGEVVDPANCYSPIETEGFFSSWCNEVTLREISVEELQRLEQLEKDAQWDYLQYESQGWSPPDYFEYGTDDEKEIWADYKSK
jgi:hypothetical protein